MFFKARVAIDELKMHGVPGGFELKPGMTVTGDIKAGERTMLTYLFARVLPVGWLASKEWANLDREATHTERFYSAPWNLCRIQPYLWLVITKIQPGRGVPM